MLQSAHNNAVGRLLRNLESLPLLQAFNVDHRAHELGIQGALIGETLDVFSCVRIDVLKRAGKLIVEPLNERDNAAGNLEKLAVFNDGRLLIVFPLLSILDNNNLLAVLEDLEKLAEFLVGPGKIVSKRASMCKYQSNSQFPLLLVHVACGAGCQVEAGGDQSQENANSLVVVDGNVEQLLHRADLLKFVCVLTSTLLHNRSQLLKNALCSVLNSLATGSNGDETIVASINDGLGTELGNPGLVLLLLLLGCLLNDLLLLHELLLVLPVQIDVPLVVAVVLLDLLADGVETTLVGGGHLFGGDLLLLVGFEHSSLEVGDGLDVHFGDLAIVLLD